MNVCMCMTLHDSNFEAITHRLRRQDINRTCTIRTFTNLKVAWYRKLDLKNNVFIDRYMVKQVCYIDVILRYNPNEDRGKRKPASDIFSNILLSKKHSLSQGDR